MSDEIKVLIVGAGFMGSLHAKAYAQIEGVRNVGIVTRNLSLSLIHISEPTRRS